MKQEFLKHYESVKEEAKQRIKDFEKFKEASNKELFEELTFCVFAANSSAEMGLTAVQLLRPVLEKGTLEDYKKRVHKKVRFYNKRAEYLYHNREKLKELNTDLKTILKKEPEEKRQFIKQNLKGFGMKEASHFLRNTGTKGLCIIDKHVLNVMRELQVIKKEEPKNEKKYKDIEQKIIRFANKNNLDVDILDLAAWSYKTGKIIK